MGINLSEVGFAYYVPKNKKKQANFILKDVQLNIDAQDEFVAIVGHTGSGKSTLVQLMNALLFSSQGTVEVFGTKVVNSPKVKLKPIRQKVGLVFQFPEYQIFEETVKKDISFGPKNFNVEGVEEAAIEAAKIMGIEPLLDKSPFKLSGGQMRKVAIAGILASNPDVLILDEPTAGLDPTAKEELLEFLVEHNQVRRKSIIIVTHDMEVVAKYMKRVIVLKAGHVMFDGSKEDLFRSAEIVEECNLDYPEIVKVLMGLKEKLNLDINVYCYNVEDAFAELSRKVGEES